MATCDNPLNLLDLDRSGLEALFTQWGEKPFRARQLLKWIYHHGHSDFAGMTDMSLALRQRLDQEACLQLPKVISEKTSVDGTCKWLIGVGDNSAVETVYIPEPNRGTLCISSQVGCMLNCTFCSTATQGFRRNLSTAEIIGQVLIAARALGHRPDQRRITNVVLMGMGEPLLNFEPMVRAVRLMVDDLALGLAGRRVTVSTAGWVPGIDQLREAVDVSLAVSLHGANDELRNQLVPLNRKYPIAELFDACHRYLAGKNRARITFEYTLIDGVNDSDDDARALVRLLRRIPSKLNLIPFNPFPGTRYRRSADARIEAFRSIILAGGLVATIRRTRGSDIDAACGQLTGQFLDRTRRRERFEANAQRDALVVATA